MGAFLQGQRCAGKIKAQLLSCHIVLRALLLALALSSVLFLGCVGGQESQAETGKAFPFTLFSSKGKQVSLSDYSGRVVLLNFWATWCGPCIIEMPGLERLYQSLKASGLEVVAISIDDSDSRHKVESFLEKTALSFTVLYDSEGSLLSRYGVMGVPETFFIGPDGQVLEFDDPRTGKKLRKVISERPWDSPAYLDAVKRLLERHLGDSMPEQKGPVDTNVT